jgi:cation:H+ antiporter
MVTGLIIVAVGTSLPELAVSLDAALQGHGAIAIGNVVGSNIVNITLVIGAGALLCSLAPNGEMLERDLPALAALTLASVWMLADGTLGRLEAIVLLLSVSAFLAYRVLQRGRKLTVVRQPKGASSPVWKVLGGFAFGLALLVGGAEAMVASAMGLARSLGVSEAVIALTVTAIATGIPEIASTLMAIKRGYAQLALGNVVGSNMMNLGVVLGLTGLVAPMSGADVGMLALLVLAGLTLLLWALFMLLPLLNRWAGAMLLALFGAYQFAVVY